MNTELSTQLLKELNRVKQLECMTTSATRYAEHIFNRGKMALKENDIVSAENAIKELQEWT